MTPSPEQQRANRRLAWRLAAVAAALCLAFVAQILSRHG